MNINTPSQPAWRRTTALLVIIAAMIVTTLLPTASAIGDPDEPEKQSQSTKKPTVVLVHGAFADSSSWNGVIRQLISKGYPVIAPANPLRGLRSDAAYLRSVLDSVQGPLVLVGHSYGGSVLSQAAAGDTDVKALVYIASFQLQAGESTAELAAKFPGGELGPTLNPVPYPIQGGGTGTDLYIKQDKFRDVFAADVRRGITTLMAATQRPITSAALEDKATKAAWKSIPNWTMITTEDLAVPAESQRFMAKRANSNVIEIDASHAITVSEPAAVARLIHRAATATR